MSITALLLGTVFCLLVLLVPVLWLCVRLGEAARECPENKPAQHSQIHLTMKPLTSQMIAKYFGPTAVIREKFFGGFRVTTPTGGDVEINQKEFLIYSADDEVYAALTLLAGEAWGTITATGSTEHILAMLSHGAANDIDVAPMVKPSSGCGAVFLTFLVFLIVLGMAGAVASKEGFSGGFVVAVCLASWLWSRVRKFEKREAQRRAQVLRYPYARLHGGRRQPSREQAARQGWI